MKNKQIALFFLIFLLMLLSRGLFLEYMDLVDPTESRYASVAAEMATSGDWLTPKLPSKEGVIPYLGKPPLHFWITAALYNTAGIEEWTSRLASFLAAIITLFFVAAFASRGFEMEHGLLSATILLSSGMFYFLAGASVTDVTLTAWVTGATVTLYQLATRQKSRSLAFCGALFSALAFLCKGPVAIVLIVLPFIIWSLARGDMTWTKKVPFVPMTLIFLLMVSPWFIANEISNPGFLKYFIWNENIARYLFREYGDRYGSGHVHSYGMSWLMLIAAFAPWSLFLLFAAYKAGVRGSWEWIRANDVRLFAFAWAISAPLFLTFVRQLHAMYLLPAMPGLAVLTACVWKTHQESLAEKIVVTKFALSFFVIALAILMVGCFASFSSYSLIMGTAIIAATLLGQYLGRHLAPSIRPIAITAWLLVSIYCLTICSMTPYINKRRSGQGAIELASRLGIKQIGVLSRNSYSHFWASKAWRSELEGKMRVEYLDGSDIHASNLDYLLAKEGSHDALALHRTNDYNLLATAGSWELLKRKGKE